ncbi:MAG: hypothetical protein COV01_03500 [Candidatus Taylorbacteria bacterium CG10_big_fil_rev_8_21_14_0_10_41_48]|uniref:Glycosyltransferase subfamily 4-like N-terminal domain-containing protein n=1 Tax=Candidatus Taylorbacteria bacterium CG10_big_fil_rev_8_21_14_0_10_41_48 TaxID=1975024 RepID=A0A2M8LB85_9BACT|nr:MAG: hypothetical protein COV01_03500 [Candidatus Taylorbacteria bacterium CG10_big_fil_rev_8_21_14_0_10_41_48]
MKIAYIVNARIPTEKAHGYQIVKMCSEFARCGAEVTLYVPARKNVINMDVFDYYGIERNFSIRVMPCTDFVKFSHIIGRLAFLLQTKVFLRTMRSLSITKDTVIYTRDSVIASRYTTDGYRVFYDAHNFPEHRTKSFVTSLKNVSGVVCNSEGTAREFSSHGFSSILVAHNAVDLSDFDISDDVATMRTKLGLPLDMKLVTYVGHLYAWKGVDVLINSAELMQNVTDTIFIIIGGTDVDIEKYSHIIQNRNILNVRLLGHKPKRDIPAYLRSSDVLVIPNVPVSKESSEYTSPIKLFEYMASRVPIIASDLPSIRAIVSEREVLFVSPGDPVVLINAIQDTIQVKAEAEVRVTLARGLVEIFSWNARASSIILFMKSR